MSRIVMSNESERDLLQIGDYIAEKLKSRRSALTTIRGIRQAIDKLEDFPLIGTPLSAVAGIDTDYRFVGHGNYLAFYRQKDGKVYVDRVLYSRRDYITILLGDLPDEDGI
ncbi:MAG: type II toxin-antitoxin system RelE/ParE family toxin [Defluviitaleaceae bacterium]|nr:type II toxin-antitoxin system RelE/ParE family toxin [Defluviitaleaceae bacterium]MCL2263689.1 type II toxin-antitoxin system RelE/ParE family toxin [Defluviitaleaceae bacterium]